MLYVPKSTGNFFLKQGVTKQPFIIWFCAPICSFLFRFGNIYYKIAPLVHNTMQIITLYFTIVKYFSALNPIYLLFFYKFFYIILINFLLFFGKIVFAKGKSALLVWLFE